MDISSDSEHSRYFECTSLGPSRARQSITASCQACRGKIKKQRSELNYSGKKSNKKLYKPSENDSVSSFTSDSVGYVQKSKPTMKSDKFCASSYKSTENTYEKTSAISDLIENSNANSSRKIKSEIKKQNNHIKNQNSKQNYQLTVNSSVNSTKNSPLFHIVHEIYDEQIISEVKINKEKLIEQGILPREMKEKSKSYESFAEKTLQISSDSESENDHISEKVIWPIKHKADVKKSEANSKMCTTGQLLKHGSSLNFSNQQSHCDSLSKKRPKRFPEINANNLAQKSKPITNIKEADIVLAEFIKEYGKNIEIQQYYDLIGNTDLQNKITSTCTNFEELKNDCDIFAENVMEVSNNINEMEDFQYQNNNTKKNSQNSEFYKASVTHMNLLNDEIRKIIANLKASDLHATNVFREVQLNEEARDAQNIIECKNESLETLKHRLVDALTNGSKIEKKEVVVSSNSSIRSLNKISHCDVKNDLDLEHVEVGKNSKFEHSSRNSSVVLNEIPKDFECQKNLTESGVATNSANIDNISIAETFSYHSDAKNYSNSDRPAVKANSKFELSSSSSCPSNINCGISNNTVCDKNLAESGEPSNFVTDKMAIADTFSYYSDAKHNSNSEFKLSSRNSFSSFNNTERPNDVASKESLSEPTLGDINKESIYDTCSYKSINLTTKSVQKSYECVTSVTKINKKCMEIDKSGSISNQEYGELKQNSQLQLSNRNNCSTEIPKDSVCLQNHDELNEVTYNDIDKISIDETSSCCSVNLTPTKILYTTNDNSNIMNENQNKRKPVKSELGTRKPIKQLYKNKLTHHESSDNILDTECNSGRIAKGCVIIDKPKPVRELVNYFETSLRLNNTRESENDIFYDCPNKMPKDCEEK